MIIPFESARRYLRKRGIESELADQLGLEVHSPDKLKEYNLPQFFGTDSFILWRVLDLHGEDTGNVGARYCMDKGNSFAELVGVRPEAGVKFAVPKGQRARLYHSPLCNWDRLREGSVVYLCESWLKSDVVAHLGLLAVGVQGIWGGSLGLTKDKVKQNVELKEDFARLAAHKPDIVVVFDSNVTKDIPKNYHAVRRLRSELGSLGLEVKWLQLPMDPGKGGGHWGIDDYIAAHGKEAGLALLRSEPEVVADDFLLPLMDFDTEVVACNEPPGVIERSTGVLYTHAVARNHRWSDRWFLGMDGKGEPKRLSVYEEWNKWEGKTRVRELDYRPGDVQVDADGAWYNVWRGSGVEPVQGDVKLFTSWVKSHVEEYDVRRWLVGWMAWQFQRPMVRMPQACMLLGPQGTGKGWIASLLRVLMGDDNVSGIGLDEMVKDFNAHFVHKQLVVVEEADTLWKDGQKIYRRMKEWITAEKHKRRALYQNARMVPARGHMLIQGNDIDVAPLEEDDRRFGVIWLAGEEFAGKAEYWNPRWDWIGSEEGQGAMLHWLLSRDLSDFNPYAPPPMTRAKRQMVALTMNPMEKVMRELVADPDSVLVDSLGNVIGDKVLSLKELYVVVTGEWYRPLSEISMAEVLRIGKLVEKVGLKGANNDNKIGVKWPKGTSNPYPKGASRYVTVRGDASWEPQKGWSDYLKGRDINGKLNRT